MKKTRQMLKYLIETEQNTLPKSHKSTKICLASLNALIKVFRSLNKIVENLVILISFIKTVSNSSKCLINHKNKTLINRI